MAKVVTMSDIERRVLACIVKCNYKLINSPEMIRNPPSKDLAAQLLEKLEYAKGGMIIFERVKDGTPQC